MFLSRSFVADKSPEAQAELGSILCICCDLFFWTKRQGGEEEEFFPLSSFFLHFISLFAKPLSYFTEKRKVFWQHSSAFIWDTRGQTWGMHIIQLRVWVRTVTTCTRTPEAAAGREVSPRKGVLQTQPPPARSTATLRSRRTALQPRRRAATSVIVEYLHSVICRNLFKTAIFFVLLMSVEFPYKLLLILNYNGNQHVNIERASPGAAGGGAGKVWAETVAKCPRICKRCRGETGPFHTGSGQQPLLPVRCM